MDDPPVASAYGGRSSNPRWILSLPPRHISEPGIATTLWRRTDLIAVMGLAEGGAFGFYARRPAALQSLIDKSRKVLP
jgi:hypothetical protein